MANKMGKRNLSRVKRIVIKVGTNTLARDGAIDMGYIHNLSSQITSLKQSGLEVLLVTSGAIGMGAGEMGITERIVSIPKRQACAAIGQPLLMHAYKKAFSEAGQVMAQVLLTSDVLSHRQTYLNLRNSVETLLSMGVIPIFNENDNISTAEIGNAFGDNDRLSALVASKVDADLLVLLTDIDALYDQDPREHKDAQPIRYVEGVSVEHLAMAGNKGQGFSTGGMRSKLEAVRIAEGAGCDVVLAHGREENILQKIVSGQEVGTLFHPLKKLRNKERWLLHADPQGSPYGGRWCLGSPEKQGEEPTTDGGKICGWAIWAWGCGPGQSGFQDPHPPLIGGNPRSDG
jgi:glutamate 5-kinase